MDTTKRDFPVNIEDIMHTAYLQYSLSVNVGRAIPEVRDGLKPGNRRILFAMRQLGLTHSHAYTKSAKVVGEVIGNYHPHGDASIYDTMVRMAQDFAMRETLVDGQGNFGSIDGDPPAAYRYTECRMERLAEELLADIDKNTVNMMPTFDETNKEPEVLPARFPNLLVNGSTGIGVGMATNIPPHNLAEVINATICILDNPSATITELMEHLPGPDFPTGATICGIGELIKLYNTGKGVVKIRAKADIIEKDSKETIIITEIPYALNKENLVKKIADLVNEKKITGIAALRDETSKRVGIRIVIEIKKNAMANVVLNQLYAHTPLESFFASTLLVVDHNRPRIMNLRDILQAYIDHRIEVITRRTQFELEKAEARAHILEGLRIAVQNIDEVVKIIRESRVREEANEALRKRFELSQIQANAILDMRLYQLTGLAIEDLEQEYSEIMKKIDYLKSLLANRSLLLQVIKDDLLEVRDKYGNPRRSEITYDEKDLKISDLIPRHSCVITVSNTGYIKRVPTDTYRTQHRGGKGIISMETKEEDYVEHLFNADSHDLIFFITNRGFMYWLNVYEIPEGTRIAKGRAIVNMIKIEPGEQIRTMLTVKKEDMEREDLYMMMCSRRGYIKKTPLAAFKNLRRTGIRALMIQDEDDLVGAAITCGRNEVLLSTAKGMACRFNEDEVRPMGRTARGVTGLRFKIPDDYIVSMVVVLEEPDVEGTEEDEKDKSKDTQDEIEPVSQDDDSKDAAQIMVVTDGGMGKRSYINTYRKTHRGAKGVVNIKLNPNEKVVTVVQIQDDEEIIITTEGGQLVRIPTDEIRTIGRASKGVRVMTFKKPKDKIVGVAKVVKVDVETNSSEDEDSEISADGQKKDDPAASIPSDSAEEPDVSEDDSTETGDGDDSDATDSDDSEEKSG